MTESAMKHAVRSVVELLRSSQIQQAVSHFRTALLKNEKNNAGEQLLEVSGRVVEACKKFNEAEIRVCEYLHLENIGLVTYWDDLVKVRAGLGPTRAETVQLYSRLLFTCNHLPGLLQLMDEMDGSRVVHKPAGNRSLLEIRLIDAGEKASDPDRISRTIDGVDMVYTACVNMARKPAVDLSMLSLSGDKDRMLVFEGDKDGVNAVKATIDLIGDELSDVEDFENFNPEQLVSELPVFDDLQTLKNLGSFSAEEVDEISRSMREGCLLVLESGALLKEDELKYSHDNKVIQLPVENAQSRKSLSDIAGESESRPTVTLKKVESREQEPAQPTSPAVSEESPDKFYQQYLKEKGRLEAASASIEKELDEELSDEAMDRLMSDIDKINH